MDSINNKTRDLLFKYLKYGEEIKKQKTKRIIKKIFIKQFC